MRTILGVAILLLAHTPAEAQPAAWTKPFPGHRVVGNLYSVGTYDLGCYLITSEDGHILINTGIDGSFELIRNNIRSVGFRMDDVKILLTMQAHWDHTAELAKIKQATGAQMWATAGDAPLLEDGGFSDPLFGGKVSFPPVKVDRVLRDGEEISLGTTRLKVAEHRGHTTGSSSYTMRVSEGGRAYNVAIANMGSINPGTRFKTNPTYPGIADDYAETFRRQKAMQVDIWVAGHASQYRLHEKHKQGQTYDPAAFVDPVGYQAAVERYEKVYLEHLAAEK